MQITNINNTFFIKQNDTATQIQLRITDAQNIPFPLDTASHIEVLIGVAEGRSLVKIPTLLPGVGELEFGLDEGDLLQTGDNRLEVHIYNANNEKVVAPSKGFYKLRVQAGIDSLGAEVTTVTLDYFLAEVDRLTVGLDETIQEAHTLIDQMDAHVTDYEGLKSNTEITLANAQEALSTATSSNTVATQTIQDASAATTSANNAAASANNAASLATTAKDDAITATQNANTATSAANTAATDAVNAKNAADVATTSANNAASSANTAATSANNAADAANTATSNANNATNAATTATSNANNATTAALNARTLADAATTRANTAASSADVATSNATNAASTANTAATNADTKATQLEQRVNAAIAATTNSAEIIDARGSHATLKTRLDTTDAQLADTARTTTSLTHGVAVVNANEDAPADIQVQGRTLTSLGNSNLQSGKKYVLADNKTKVIPKGTNGQVVAGVAKFANDYLTTTANFTGKVPGSISVNPHTLKWNGSAAILPAPTDPNWGEEDSSSKYQNVATLDGTVLSYSEPNNGEYGVQLFSFNIIEQVERTLGRIPKDTVADKVQWLKDNLSKLTANWHGFGSSVGGNKASFCIWSGTTWEGANTNLTGVVSKVSVSITAMLNRIDANGIVSYLAYAEPTDGVTPSTINTDYIDLVVELKDTAQLDTRPTIIRVENFEGKVSGSTVENPHYSSTSNITSLGVPSAFTVDRPTERYQRMYRLDGTSSLENAVGTTNGAIAQQLFSFNLIEAVERNIGKIPKSTVADKVQWLKDNVGSAIAFWHGYGSSVGGNKATLVRWNVPTSAWVGATSHTSGSVVRLFKTENTSFPNMVDTNGFIHFLAYAEPSDGTTASTINTDYVELEIQLKQTANFTAPKVPLYEVPDDEYNKILVDWNADEVRKRYPVVESTQHLTNPYVMVEGENLLPPFTEWNLHANAKVLSPYELELNATAGYQSSYYDVPCLPNQIYNMMGGAVIRYLDSNKATLGDANNGSFINGTITTPANCRFMRVQLMNGAGAYTAVFRNPMLTLGSTAKPFVPRNPSYLFADVKLGQIGTVKDTLFKQDGRWKVRKAVEKDVVLDGSLAWTYSTDNIGNKRVKIPLSNFIQNSQVATKYNGTLLKIETSSPTDADCCYTNPSEFFITISDTDSGWAEAMTPTPDLIKAYFNGWKYTGNGTPPGHSWISMIDGSVPFGDVKTTIAPGFTPYRLSYVLATPQIVDVTDKIEGDLVVNGLTMCEVGSGVIVREKVVPQATSLSYVINDLGTFTSTDNPFKFRTNKIIAVYKNGVNDTAWSLTTDNANKNGLAIAKIPIANYDPTAEYTVTYLVLDRQLFTNNATEVAMTYANNIRTALSDLVTDVSDNTTMLSIHEKAIVEMYIRLKALEG